MYTHMHNCVKNQATKHTYVFYLCLYLYLYLHLYLCIIYLYIICLFKYIEKEN